MSESIFELLELFETNSVETKFKQIVDAVVGAIRNNKLHNGDRLPSVRDMCAQYSISRDTVCKAYEIMREKGIIEKTRSKGYAIANDKYNDDLNVFIMFDIWNSYKEDIYKGIFDTFTSINSGSSVLQVYYSNRDEDHFEEFLMNNYGKYEYYVLMSFPSKKVEQVIKQLDQSKLLVADVCTEYAGAGATVIAQDHDHELTKALNCARQKIMQYKEFVLCAPDDCFIPAGVKRGFKRFCQENGIKHSCIKKLTANKIAKGNAYFVIEDPDLVTIITYARDAKYKFGRDLGLLSYNSTPLKKLVEGGISTVSIDFYRMGVLIAQQIMNRDKAYQLVPTEFIEGNTL